MIEHIYTAGYTGLDRQSLADFADLCSGLVVDVRFSPHTGTQWDKRELGNVLGGRYLSLVSCGNSQHKAGGMAIANIDDCLFCIGLYTSETYRFRSFILLCACRDYNSCHRLDVSHKLNDFLPNHPPVRHLSPSKIRAALAYQQARLI